MKLAYLREALEKFALTGATYARALENAAARTGRMSTSTPAMIDKIRSQPRAQLQPAVSEQVRFPTGELRTDMPGRNQALFNKLPKDSINTEVMPMGRGDPQQQARFNSALRRGGAVYRAPGTQAKIDEAFGPPRPQQDPTATGAPRSLGGAQAGASPAAKTNVTPMPGAPSKLAPATREGPVGGVLARPGAGAAGATGVGRMPVAPAAGGRQFARARFGKMASLGDLAAKAAPYAIGIGVPLATAGGILASKPGIRANLKNLQESKGTVQEKDLSAELPPEVVDTATRAHAALTARGIDPTSLRIAVDAPPGSGKTTLSRALAQQLGVQHYGLDWLPHNKFHAIMGGGHIEKMPRAPRAGEILEHYNLLRSYDPEMFDVAFHIQKDPEVIKQQILDRGRSAGMHTIMDYDKSLAVGRMAFDTLAGDAEDLGGGVMMKVRPQTGWGEAQLNEQLQAKGIDPTKLTRHQKLLSLHEGKAVGGAGWTPYFKSPFTGGETAALAASVPLGIGAALAARHFLG